MQRNGHVVSRSSRKPASSSTSATSRAKRTLTEDSVTACIQFDYDSGVNFIEAVAQLPKHSFASSFSSSLEAKSPLEAYIGHRDHAELPPPSLSFLAAHALAVNISYLSVDHLRDIPWHNSGYRIWERLTDSQLINLQAWKTFATVYGTVIPNRSETLTPSARISIFTHLIWAPASAFLTVLDLSAFPTLANNTTELVSLAHLPNLAALDISGSAVTDSTFANLARAASEGKFAQLTLLCVSRCKSITDRTVVKHLPHFKALRVLECENTSINGDILERTDWERKKWPEGDIPSLQAKYWDCLPIARDGVPLLEVRAEVPRQFGRNIGKKSATKNVVFCYMRRTILVAVTKQERQEPAKSRPPPTSERAGVKMKKQKVNMDVLFGLK
ncbi:hypothetical protein SAICODRAFT_108606 [Saitoella complicata NRRL Y-17804]|uniref:F-box/LRR-repeat protein 15-like leucin rich repeat domain-containing protein n=1 Tax=Saitoella complicata (strain BCRC 22490 / CBS 7301 / JCM 7358 / NBRC 10748 / NRRL Y-17804) TaxID=698492 RepID=A0A0E9NAZ7_SAICN|nr:uncharacterized protein SAICODRAFT_108606 [Saitoella complicata NRRL Y-17804]ODQ56447.1 hypothetical protein SAICODRAFT_108606 [Saitoella complicata NRRL Y-17804]GAO46585.1 hypothetical protein G7K_0814-t1 [Saitoella complicata NRRL Y-17804]